MPFLDDVPIKGCEEEAKDETLDSRGVESLLQIILLIVRRFSLGWKK